MLNEACANFTKGKAEDIEDYLDKWSGQNLMTGSNFGIILNALYPELPNIVIFRCEHDSSARGITIKIKDQNNHNNSLYIGILGAHYSRLELLQA